MAQGAIIAMLPDREGNYKPTKIPNYISAILKNVTHEYDYTYRLNGVNPMRPTYGIEADLNKLGTWAKRYYADFEVKAIHKFHKNYYGIFFMTDPVCLQLEKVGLLKK